MLEAEQCSWLWQIALSVCHIRTTLRQIEVQGHRAVPMGPVPRRRQMEIPYDRAGLSNLRLCGSALHAIRMPYPTVDDRLQRVERQTKRI